MKYNFELTPNAPSKELILERVVNETCLVLEYGLGICLALEIILLTSEILKNFINIGLDRDSLENMHNLRLIGVVRIHLCPFIPSSFTYNYSNIPLSY